MEPIAEQDLRFGDATAPATPWAEVVRVLETAELFWIASVRVGGQPHVTPLPAVWHDDRLHFCTGADEQKAVNIARSPQVALTTGCNRWKEGLDVVVEGAAVRVSDDSRLRMLADLWRSKYQGDWDFTVDDGMFHHGGGDALVFEVAPAKVLAFAKGAFAQTRFRFPVMNSTARRMFELVEPIGVIPYAADEPNEAMFALGFTNYWDTYFAGRAAPLGLVPAEVVDALFYNFAPGEVARHIPKVWNTTTPDAAIAARQRGCVQALQRILGDHVDTPAFARAADLLTKAATGAPIEGRPMYAALRALPIPDEVVARLFHAASLLREHRGDGHIAALMVEGVGRLEAHVLLALDMDMPAHEFGRIHHLPAAQIDAVIDGMRDRGLIGDDGWLSEEGRAVKQRVEARTDDLAAAPYEKLESGELDELMSILEPFAARLVAAQPW